jgi:hypothetical protein
VRDGHLDHAVAGGDMTITVRTWLVLIVLSAGAWTTLVLAVR